MNLVKLQNTKVLYRNLLCFCTLTMNYQKEKLRKQHHLQSHQIEVKDSYSENFKTWMKKIEDDRTDGKGYLCSQIRRMLL